MFKVTHHGGGYAPVGVTALIAVTVAGLGSRAVVRWRTGAAGKLRIIFFACRYWKNVAPVRLKYLVRSF